MVALFWLSLAHATLVGVPPDGRREVTLLVCPPDDCSDRLFWVEHEPSLREEPILLAEALLAANVASTAAGDRQAVAFNAALERAGTAVAAKAWADADRALDDAARALEPWQGSPPNAALFALWYLRGGVAAAQGYSAADRDFAAAAAVAWNRELVLPDGPAEWRGRYDHAVADLIREAPGTLVLERGAGDPVYTLDGVLLGKAPTRVQAFAGAHRLSARDATADQDWRTTVTLLPGRVTTSQARFPSGSDGDWAAGLLSDAVTNHAMDRELGDLLAGWAARYGVKSVRLLRLDPLPLREPRGADDIAFPLYSATQLWYAPETRRFSGSP